MSMIAETYRGRCERGSYDRLRALALSAILIATCAAESLADTGSPQLTKPVDLVTPHIVGAGNGHGAVTPEDKAEMPSEMADARLRFATN